MHRWGASAWVYPVLDWWTVSRCMDSHLLLASACAMLRGCVQRFLSTGVLAAGMSASVGEAPASKAGFGKQTLGRHVLWKSSVLLAVAAYM